jgi:hypothetical protein
MADEFLEHDLETPTEQDVDLAYGSKYLSAADVGTRKIRTKVLKVRKEEVNDRETGKKKMKLLVFFESLDKALVLNATNKDTLVESLGKPPVNWIGATVGIKNDPSVTFAGKRTGGLRLQVLLPPATAAKPAPMKPVPAAEVDWTEEGDPGPHPDLNDAVPEFGPAT